MGVVVIEQKSATENRILCKKIHINLKKVVDKDKKVLYYVYMKQPVAHLGVSGVFTKKQIITIF